MIYTESLDRRLLFDWPLLFTKTDIITHLHLNLYSASLTSRGEKRSVKVASCPGGNLPLGGCDGERYHLTTLTHHTPNIIQVEV